MKVATEHHFIGLTASLGGTYDSNKTLLGSLLKQYTGSNYEDKYIAPLAPAIVEIMESANLGGRYCIFDVVEWQNKFLIFVGQYQGTVSGGESQYKNILLFEFEPNTSVFTYKGRIIIDITGIPIPRYFGSTGAQFFRSIKGIVYTNNDGNVSTSGSSTTITGSGTQFNTNRIASGARIGFGSTSTTGITAWYTINSITNDTQLTIDSPVNLSVGTSYAIEELRLAMSYHNITNFSTINGYESLAYGGLMLVKGLNYDIFTNSGTTVGSMTSDNTRGFCILRSNLGGDFSREVTISLTSPAVFTCNNHGLQRSDQVWISTTGALPTGITTFGYYSVHHASGNTFIVSGLNASGSQSGTHYLHRASTSGLIGISDDYDNKTTEHIVWAMQMDNSNSGQSVANRFVKFNLRANLNLRGVSGTVGARSWPSTPTFLSSDAYISETRTVNPNHTSSGTFFTGYIQPFTFFARKTGLLAGVTSFWWGMSDATTTNTRIYRAPLENLTYTASGSLDNGVPASPNWPTANAHLVADSMIEIPPGSSTTYSGDYRTNQIVYAKEIDRILISPYANFSAIGTKRICVVDYDPNRMKPYEKIVGCDLNRLYLSSGASASATGAAIGLFPRADAYLCEKNGWLFTSPYSGLTGASWIHAFPYAVDSEYHLISNQYVITPKLSTKDATKLYRVYVDNMEYAGSERLGFPVESYRMWYRNVGIDDNTGDWIPLNINGSLTDVNPTDYIQFKITFDILGEICAPTRIYSIAVIYEDGSQDSHYEPSLNKSSSASKIFAWRQVSSWGGNIPNLRIRLFDANNETILDDTVTSSKYGIWQYSTDGSTWNTWSSSADTVGNYIRYTVSSFGYGSISVRTLLTQV